MPTFTFFSLWLSLSVKTSPIYSFQLNTPSINVAANLSAFLFPRAVCFSDIIIQLISSSLCVAVFSRLLFFIEEFQNFVVFTDICNDYCQANTPVQRLKLQSPCKCFGRASEAHSSCLRFGSGCLHILMSRMCTMHCCCAKAQNLFKMDDFTIISEKKY